uniref:Uncharacterized protein n=1 Tax=Romanomermis culicivorax TaxID=13658 RepID=A0A915KJS1_ROMCU
MQFYYFLLLIQICSSSKNEKSPMVDINIPKFNYSSRYRNSLLKPLPWHKDGNFYWKNY